MSSLHETINESNFKEALRLANKFRYANDPSMRAKINEKKREYDRRKRQDPEYRNTLNEKQKHYYANNEVYRETQKQQKKERYKKLKEEKLTDTI
jgi:hypothetical protein